MAGIPQLPLLDGSSLNAYRKLTADKVTARKYLIQIRDARLLEVDAIEKLLDQLPRTSQIRAWYKEHNMNTID